MRETESTRDTPEPAMSPKNQAAIDVLATTCFCHLALVPRLRRYRRARNNDDLDGNLNGEVVGCIVLNYIKSRRTVQLASFPQVPSIAIEDADDNQIRKRHVCILPFRAIARHLVVEVIVNVKSKGMRFVIRCATGMLYSLVVKTH